MRLLVASSPRAIAAVAAATTVVLAAQSALVAAAAGAGRHAPDAVLRALQNQQYTYLSQAELSYTNLVYGKCLRVKVPEQNDDADAEGNSYFYNGRYYAQHMQFASFFLCQQDSSNTCGSCDFSSEYVTDLNDFLDAGLEYLTDYCEACANTCGYNQNRRFLQDEGDDGGGDEEEQNDDGMAVNAAFSTLTCNHCKSTCYKFDNGNGDGNGVNDERNFLECQEAFADENDGTQYYSGPMCKNGAIEIGLFYDQDCSIHSAANIDYGFSYTTFGSMRNNCWDCSSGVCDNLYANSLHCQFGKDVLGTYAVQNNMQPCKKFYEAGKTREFKQRRSHRGLKLVLGFMLTTMLVGGFLFGSYTYYLRHRPGIVPLSENSIAEPTGFLSMDNNGNGGVGTMS